MDKKLYVLAGYDNKTSKQLDEYKSILDRYPSNETKELPHHMTLASFDVSKQISLETILDKIEKEVTFFPISFQHVGTFSGANVLFIAPSTNLSLLNLRYYFSDSLDWVAHTTMLIYEPEVVYEAYKKLISSFKPFNGNVTTLYLYEFFPAKLIKRIELKTP